MQEYMIITIRPESKTELTQKGRRSYFSVTDRGYGILGCFNRYLYPAIQLGQEVQVRIAQDKRSVIVDVIGFKPDYPQKTPRRPINKAEGAFYDLMGEHNWEVTKKGWPDFACFKDGRLVLVEIKPKRSHRLKLWQSKLMLELVKNGVQCYRWSPDGGFEPILEHVKFPVNLP